MDLLFPTTRQRVLAQLLLNPDETFHSRELARLTESHAGTVGRELEKRMGVGLLLRTEQGTHGAAAAERVRKNLNERGTLEVLRRGVEMLGLKEPLPLVRYRTNSRLCWRRSSRRSTACLRAN